MTDYIEGDGIVLQPPKTDLKYAREKLDLLRRNDFVYPHRFSLRSMKSPDDVLKMAMAQIEKIKAGTDLFYDIYRAGKIIGEIYNKDSGQNIGYFVDKAARGNGVATEAIRLICEKLFKDGAKQLTAFTHYFDQDIKLINGDIYPAGTVNQFSERAILKNNFSFIGEKKDPAIHDPFSGLTPILRVFQKSL